MAILTRDQIFKADDLPKKKMSIPEWGGEIYIRTLTAKERDQYEQETYRQLNEGVGVNNMRSRLVLVAAVDEKGSPIFKATDLPELEKKSGEVMNRIFESAKEMSGLTYDEVEGEAKN